MTEHRSKGANRADILLRSAPQLISQFRAQQLQLNESNLAQPIQQSSTSSQPDRVDPAVQGLVETIVVEQDTGAGIHVGEGVLGLAVLGQDAGGDLAVQLDQLEERGGGDGGTALGVGHQGLEAGVGLAEHGVAVAGDDAAAVESRPEV
ncbi:hypothetical protein V491_02050, partial [Pseudogymnoascus sp. VKM F-3775]